MSGTLWHDLNVGALLLGWVVLGLACLAVLAWAGLTAWHFFPARFDFLRDTNAVLRTPHGDFRITLHAGISARRKVRWVVAFLLLKGAA